jgi:hypothetical protein
MKRRLGLMEETLGDEREDFGGPTFHLQAQMTGYKCQNVTLERVDVIFRVSYEKFLS